MHTSMKAGMRVGGSVDLLAPLRLAPIVHRETLYTCCSMKLWWKCVRIHYTQSKHTQKCTTSNAQTSKNIHACFLACMPARMHSLCVHLFEYGCMCEFVCVVINVCTVVHTFFRDMCIKRMYVSMHGYNHVLQEKRKSCTDRAWAGKGRQNYFSDHLVNKPRGSVLV